MFNNNNMVVVCGRFRGGGNSSPHTRRSFVFSPLHACVCGTAALVDTIHKVCHYTIGLGFGSSFGIPVRVRHEHGPSTSDDAFPPVFLCFYNNIVFFFLE